MIYSGIIKRLALSPKKLSVFVCNHGLLEYWKCRIETISLANFLAADLGVENSKPIRHLDFFCKIFYGIENEGAPRYTGQVFPEREGWRGLFDRQRHVSPGVCPCFPAIVIADFLSRQKQMG